MSSEHKILAIQSLESLEHADKTVTVAVTIYYFETDMLCNSCVRYEDAGGISILTHWQGKRTLVRRSLHD
jgi:hypothetical protein